MIEFEKNILSNKQFINLCKEKNICNSFLFESDDNIFLENFVLTYAKFLLCNDVQNNLSCQKCSSCLKIDAFSHPDLIVYPKSNKNILVDDVKDLIENAYLSSIEGDKKIFIFKNFSSSTIQAQNKLLKILEEPPKNVYIMLCVSNINKVLPTVLSRCKKIRLEKLSKLELLNYIDKPGLNENDYNKIIDISQGSVEKALYYTKDELFINTFDSCIDTLVNLKDSKDLLKFSSKFFSNKETFELSLNIFEVLFRDMLLLRSKNFNLVLNKQIISKISSVIDEFDCDSVDKIIRKIYSIKKQLDFNCNYILLVDSFLLYILEVKFYAKKG